MMAGDREWYVVAADSVIGPMGADELAARARKHEIDTQTYVWHAGLDDWALAGDVTGLFGPHPMLLNSKTNSKNRETSAPEINIHLGLSSEPIITRRGPAGAASKRAMYHVPIIVRSMKLALWTYIFLLVLNPVVMGLPILLCTWGALQVKRKFRRRTAQTADSPHSPDDAII